MKSSIILKPWELKAAIEGKLTCIVRPMKVQPPDSRYKLGKVTDSYCDKMNGKCLWYLPNEILEKGLYFNQPYSPGETAFVKETWGWSVFASMPPSSNYKHFLIYKIDDNAQSNKPYIWKSAVTMPRWASRFTITWKEVKAKQAKSFILADVQKCGCDLTYSGFDEEESPKPIEWMYAIYKCTPDTWLWLYEVEVKQ